jgi:hypothetical protein
VPTKPAKTPHSISLRFDWCFDSCQNLFISQKISV